MTDSTAQTFRKKQKTGKMLTLILLIYGLTVTILAFLTGATETVSWLNWLAPFTIASIPFHYWFNPAFVFIPMAVLALAGWMMIHLGRLFGREVIIGCMVVYLALNLFFTPFYLLLGSASWQVGIVGSILGLSLCGTIYPVLVLLALHRWNPRRK